MRLWAIERKIELKFVEPGSPYQNGYVERFNKSYREEVLDAFTFRKLGEATALTQAWLWMYNSERPHELLGYKSPVDFAQERLRSKAPQTLLCDSNFNWKSLVLNASNQGKSSYGDAEQKAKQAIKDNELLAQFKAVEEMDTKDKSTIKDIIDAYIKRSRLSKIAAL